MSEPTRKVKPYPATPPDMPIQYVPTWRDRLHDAARAALLVVIVVEVAVTAALFAFGR